MAHGEADGTTEFGIAQRGKMVIIMNKISQILFLKIRPKLVKFYSWTTEAIFLE